LPAVADDSGWSMLGFLEQVKRRDLLTSTVQISHEESQIHRSPGHWDVERTKTRHESIGPVPEARYQRRDVLQLEKQIHRDERRRTEAAEKPEQENARINKIVANQSLEIDIIKDLLKKF
jgi:hypothetical protein